MTLSQEQIEALLAAQFRPLYDEQLGHIAELEQLLGEQIARADDAERALSRRLPVAVGFEGWAWVIRFGRFVLGARAKRAK